MNVPAQFWSRVTQAIAQLSVHQDRGLCIRPKPNTVPLRFCIRKAVGDSKCCTLHKSDCPVK